MEEQKFCLNCTSWFFLFERMQGYLKIEEMLASSRYSRKAAEDNCRKYRGISLLSIAGKILSRILLNRINMHVAPVVLPESQCDFRSGRGTMDMTFCLRPTQEKFIKQNMSLYAVFIDFTKAFDTVSKDGLWQVLTKFGCPVKFVNIVKSLNSGMQASVAYGYDQSKVLAATNGVKQGCVLAPTLFFSICRTCWRLSLRTALIIYPNKTKCRPLQCSSF